MKLCAWSIARGMLWLIFVLCALAGGAHGQVKQIQPDTQVYGPDKAKVPEAIAKVKSGDFTLGHVELIAEANAVEAIPDLEKQFVRSQDQLDKAKIAQALVKLGDKNDTYWDFLVQAATPAVESDAPDFINRDSQGKELPGPSPEFVAWVKAHNLAPPTAAADAEYIYPGKVMLLGATGDRRAIPLLRQALLSHNYLIEAAAARGLAEIQDKDSIILIVDVCKKAPTQVAGLIAEPLLYFDDPQAQDAVDKYVPKAIAKDLREARAKGKTPFH
jgi:HEAT repeat protein